MSDNETSEGNPRCYHDDPEEVPVSPDQMQLLEVPNGNRPHRNHDGAGMSGNNTSRMRYEGQPKSILKNRLEREEKYSQRRRRHSSADEDDLALLHGRFEKVPLKDFHAEIRAFKDVEDFLSRTLLMLDLQKTGLTQIIDAMVKKILEKKEVLAQTSLDEARQAIFTQDSVHTLSKTIQGTMTSDESGFDFDQNWICVMCDIPTLTKRHVVIARLHTPANLGSTSQEVQFVILVLAPVREKSTKSSLETARTFATLFLDMDFRHQLLMAESEFEFKQLLHTRTKLLIEEQGLPENRKSHLVLSAFEQEEMEAEKSRCPIGQGLVRDVKRRLPHYLSDYKDGIVGNKTLHKVTSTTFFLYFACVLPNIAFGMLNDNNTAGVIDVQKVLFSQCVGGVLFAVFGGQPLIVLLTTAPLALYTKIIFSICEDFDLNFNAMFACTGLWNAFFLFIYVFFNMSKLMKYSSRSTEEVFSLFITFAFSADAIKDTIKDFNKNYHTDSCQGVTHSNSSNQNASLLTNTSLTTVSTVTTTSPVNLTNSSTVVAPPGGGMLEECLRENSILFLLLMLGTVWLGITLFNFTKTPFLNAGKREILADYALPVAVLIMTFFGSYVFREVKMKPFKYKEREKMFELAPLHLLPPGAVFAAAGLGFSLSLLFFMDQNISSALVNAPSNKLKKGAAYHWDLFVVAVINAFLSIFTMPWVHAALPHSPLHVRALADLEDRVDQGHVHQIVVHVRETRLTGIISHVMIGLSMLMLPYPLAYIPRPVLDGLFIYVAITALYGNQLFDRILLFFTEQSAYPPNHYIRRVPQRKVHLFTTLQLIQLLVLCVFGFSPIPYMKMVFPVLIMLLMPIRHKIIPHFFEPKYLKALDGHAH
ncbi:solute carrier family 4 member 11-like isoform X3 [Ostrea edulis]|nr:solute carrier family 4 member 11-like isoform X3 [Ostrea edulis]XP_048760518.2 solute carrier family 4 member 11-like isoform X3 [Ostrea edulis]XP_048760519.2 solute carrier family 4 member 11-like isoform X3 [Ostrea edulis]XP_048760520.2 solute carrier family 4 member 11-like isoform X3 [Ostrea edulis]